MWGWGERERGSYRIFRLYDFVGIKLLKDFFIRVVFKGKEILLI